MSAPWLEIKARIISGETPYRIEKDLNNRGIKITRQGIAKRAKKEGWEPDGNGGYLSVAENLPITQREDHGVSRGLRTAERVASILQALHDGAPEYLAAEANGIAAKTLTEWKKEDPQFAAAVHQARMGNLVGQVKVIHDAGKRGDWKAADRLLQVAPETKEVFGASGGGGVTIVLNIQRGQTEDCIDVTPGEARSG